MAHSLLIQNPGDYMALDINQINATSNLSSVTPDTGTIRLTAGVGHGMAATNATMSFGDLLDALNPLQHIPVLSSL